MSTITKEWLQQKISEMEAIRDDIPFGLGEDGTNTLAALRIALASLEAEASGRNPVLAYADSYRDMANQGVESIPVWSVITDLERNIAPLFTATPAPVSVPDAMEMDDDFDSAFEHGKSVGWNAYRAAMLQSFGNSEQLNSPVIQDGWVMVPVEPTAEMISSGIAAHYERNQIQIHDRPAPGPMECAYVAMIAAVPHFREISNSSTNNFRENAETSTKCWCHTCRPVTISDMRFVVCPECGNKRCPHTNDHRNACTGSNEPGQEGSAYPAAPQQEVKP